MILPSKFHSGFLSCFVCFYCVLRSVFCIDVAGIVNHYLTILHFFPGV